jgi:hypothetical protein
LDKRTLCKQRLLSLQTIFWHPEDEDHLETVSSVEEILLFLKALRKHSEVSKLGVA